MIEEIASLSLAMTFIMRKSYGFRTYEMLELALYYALGDLPEPKMTHRFF